MTSCVPYPPPIDPIQPLLAAFAAGLLAGLSFSASSPSTPPALQQSRTARRTAQAAHERPLRPALALAPRPPRRRHPPARSDRLPSNRTPPPLPYSSSALEERQYLELAHSVIERGELRSQVKGGTGARAIFTPDPLHFALSRPVDPTNLFSPLENVIPLLTTKRMPFGVIREEFAWMVRGETDVKVLEAKGVKVWTENSSRDYLNSRGLEHLEAGDIGPAYGFQWRHAGAEYRGCEADCAGEGVDQLARIVRSILETPQKRKHVLVAWSPADVDDMAVPPCPILHQFYLHDPVRSLLHMESKPRLSCIV